MITKIGLVIAGLGLLVGLGIIPCCKMFSGISDFGGLVYFYVLFSALNQIFLCDLRGKELLMQFSVANILNTILIATFNILFLCYFRLGIQGYLLAFCIANAITMIYSVIVGRGYRAVSAKLDKMKMHEMVAYSIVLIPNSFMWWIMNSSDHIMVTSMIGASANGVYAISYKLPTLISTLTQIFNQAWNYSAIKEQGAEDEEEYNNFILNRMIIVVMLIGIAMITFIKPFLKYYVADNYYEAWKYTPFLIVGCVYLTLGTFVATSYSVHKDSVGFLISGSVGAFLNVILNMLLIPVIGVYGAAFATCISYITVFVFRVFHTRKYIRYKVLTKEFLFGSVVMILSAILMYVDSFSALLTQIVIFGCSVYTFRRIWMDLLYKIIRKDGEK